MPIFMKEFYEIMERNVIMNALFLSLSRVVWAISISWLIYSCCSGWNEKLNNFLSNKYWMLISRLGLSIYLIHPVLQFSLTVVEKQSSSLDIFVMVRIL